MGKRKARERASSCDEHEDECIEEPKKKKKAVDPVASFYGEKRLRR